MGRFLSVFWCLSASLLAVLLLDSGVRSETASLLNHQTGDTLAVKDPLAGRVNSIAQLADVQPTDWAFQALQALNKRYGCIADDSAKTTRGNQSLTRSDFAVELNACLDRVNNPIAAATDDPVTKEDLATLLKLQEQFAAELATLRSRVDAVEAKTTTVEKQQFSTTTKLSGNIVFGVVGASGNSKAVSSSDANQQRVPIDNNLIFADRVRLVLNTSFTGKDRLITRLQAGNTPNFGTATGTDSAKLAFQDTRGNQVVVNQLEYRFPIGDRGTVFVEAFGFLDLFVPTLHPLDGDYDTVLTGFSLRCPIYFPSGVTGAGINYDLTPSINIGGGY